MLMIQDFKVGQCVVARDRDPMIGGTVVQVAHDRWGQEVVIINEFPGPQQGERIALRQSELHLVDR